MLPVEAGQEGVEDTQDCDEEGDDCDLVFHMCKTNRGLGGDEDRGVFSDIGSKDIEVKELYGFLVGHSISFM